MWKDFFYFSGSQRAGILVLLCLIILVGLIDLFLPFFFESTPEDDDTLFLAEIDAFKKSLVAIDSMEAAERFRNYSSYYNSSEHFVKATNDKPAVLSPFNPNKLDSSGFVTLGLKPYIVSNILKYRRKGGLFKDRESFARIYGISEKQYLALFPYIQLPEKYNVLKDTVLLNVDKTSAGLIVQVELNAADTTALMQIKGIGPAYARSIVHYRKQTGGFISIEQLSEIYGMTPENLERIKPYCTINHYLIRKIKVNTASVERLKAHPYLNFYQAKQIYELRRKKGTLTGMEDLNKLSELNEATLTKIAAYLNFE